jgi:hypothetical protein
MSGVTVERFRAVLLEAVHDLSAMQPEALREPLSLWLRATEERSRREGWRHLLGRDVVAAWNAAVAVLVHPGPGPAPEPQDLPAAEDLHPLAPVWAAIADELDRLANLPTPILSFEARQLLHTRARQLRKWATWTVEQHDIAREKDSVLGREFASLPHSSSPAATGEGL